MRRERELRCRVTGQHRAERDAGFHLHESVGVVLFRRAVSGDPGSRHLSVYGVSQLAALRAVAVVLRVRYVAERLRSLGLRLLAFSSFFAPL